MDTTELGHPANTHTHTYTGYSVTHWPLCSPAPLFGQWRNSSACLALGWCLLSMLQGMPLLRPVMLQVRLTGPHCTNEVLLQLCRMCVSLTVLGTPECRC
jgi:hypothetical protein